MERDWVVNIRSQCDEGGVPFFFKQWGGVRKSEAGRELDGRTFDGVPPISRRPVPNANIRKSLIGEYESMPLTDQPQLIRRTA
jgi:hypothetical protein